MKTTTITTLTLLSTIGGLAVGLAGEAQAATPTYYNNLPAFQADITNTFTDDYSNAGYVFNQNNAQMSAVVGQTDYQSTGHANLNLVLDSDRYCSGCNGSFLLSFQTTTVGTAAGVNGAGFNIMASDNSYYAYITFADGTTANIQLPGAGSFWAVAAPERIQSIHVGLSNGATTTGGYFEMDNLIIGDGNIGLCNSDADCVQDMDPCTDHFCIGGVCTPQLNVAPCDDGEVCTENDVCSLGLCQGNLVSCEDGNPCTTNFCDFGAGCAMINNADPCDDGNVCTEADECSLGACGGVEANCSDDDVCTADSCDPVMGCVSEPVAGCCDADDDCVDGEVCDLDTNTCAGAPAGSSSGGGGEESSDSGMPGSTGTPGETGVDGTGDGESGVGTGGTGVGLDTGAGSSGGSGDATGTLPEEDPDFGACNCTSEPSPAGRWLWLMAGLGVIARRRRRRAA